MRSAVWSLLLAGGAVAAPGQGYGYPSEHYPETTSTTSCTESKTTSHAYHESPSSSSHHPTKSWTSSVSPHKPSKPTAPAYKPHKDSPTSPTSPYDHDHDGEGGYGGGTGGEHSGEHADGGHGGYQPPTSWYTSTVPWGTEILTYTAPVVPEYPTTTLKASPTKHYPGTTTSHYPEPTETEACVPCKGQPGDNPDEWCGYTIHDNWYEVMPITCKTREYFFTVENKTIAPDGISRIGLIVNGQMPGPKIEANWVRYRNPQTTPRTANIS